MKISIFTKLLFGTFLLITCVLVGLDVLLVHSFISESPRVPAAELQKLSLVRDAVPRRIAEVVVAWVICLLLAYFFSRSINWRIQHLKRFADSLLDAGRNESPLPDSNDEIGALNGSLRLMAAKIRDLVAGLSLESARLEAVLAGMAEGVLAVDSKLQVIFCNRSFAQLFGLKYPVLSGMPVVDLIRDPDLLTLLNSVIDRGESLKTRLQLSTREGGVFEAQAASLAMPPKWGAILILHDITDLERLERVRKDFVANVSHELRTPLTAIGGYAETLLAGALDDRENNRRFVEIIRAHAIRLNNIASDLLILSDLESGRPTAEPEIVSVLEAVEVALLTVESEARVRGVDLVRGDLHDVEVRGHKLRLEQALVNLLDNAIKFNRAGGEVRIESTVNQGQAWIAIADTGSGIPSDDLSRIFERFYRVDKARSREVGGTGLGLSIVKHVVERMNGNVRVESQLGKGSTFIVSIPAA